MQTELNEGMERYHPDNEFMDHFIHPLLLHHLPAYFGEGLVLFDHPYQYFFDLFEGPEGHCLVS